MTTTEQMEALTSNRIDLGLVRQPFDRRGVEVVCVLHEVMVLAVPAGHTLATKPAISLRNLDRESLVMYSPIEGRYFYDLIVNLLRMTEIVPNYVQFVSQTHTMLALVGAGMGVALVPASAQKLLMRDVVFRELSPAPTVLSELHMVWRRNQDNPAFRVFRDLVLDRLADHEP